ncbi:hypothetical protein [Pedobacter boryungensis]|uniref:Uncharacterized protein n=1 Tax=Pedobacter boryungensis TaxID=869962 RepID=A0ABX2D997_9SPHI|nr:hypothetical protein [Pedobacter boryungensis]NQX30628.1 hypothetical protein [Pedobacter boryungensis]
MHPIKVVLDKKVYEFQVGEYPHHDEQNCKLNVFKDGKLVANFTPDRHHILHLCKNHGKLKEPLIHAIADSIEQIFPHGFLKLNKI